MLGSQLKQIPSIWLFLVGLVILSFGCQTAIRLLNQDGEPLLISETASLSGGSGIKSITKELAVEASNVEQEKTSSVELLSTSQIIPEANLMVTAGRPVDGLSSVITSELNSLSSLSPLAIQKKGFEQDDRFVAYAFLVHNPNEDLTITNSEYQVIAYDESGGVVLTDSELIDFILPDQSLGIAGSLHLEDDIPITDLAVQINSGEPYLDDEIPNLDIRAVKYRPGEYYDRVTGLLAGPYGQDVENLRVSAIAYDDTGNIIGSGYAFISFIHAGSVTGVDITITDNGIVDHVELFPRLSYSSISTSQENMPKYGQVLSFLQSSFVQNDLEVGYGFLLENPNEVFAIEDSIYRMTAFDSAGTVIHVDEGHIDRVLPGQTFGVGGTFFVDKGEVVDSLDLQLKTGAFRQSALLSALEAGTTTILGDNYNSIVIGDITNHHGQPFEDIKVTAIVFDADDQIVGGGFTWLDYIPAGDSSPVKVWITSVDEPVSAQLYTSGGTLVEIE